MAVEASRLWMMPTRWSCSTSLGPCPNGECERTVCDMHKAPPVTGCHVRIACRRATELGVALGWLLNEVKTKGKAPVFADELLKVIVEAIRRACRVALCGFNSMSDMERALAAIVPISCVTSAAVTRDYRSSNHKDGGNVCDDAFMSSVAWFAEGVKPSRLLRGLVS